MSYFVWLDITKKASPCVLNCVLNTKKPFLSKKNLLYYNKLQKFLGWLEGIEPSNMRVTVARVNRFTTATIREEV